MKKLFSLFRSMRFGIILLVLIAALSVIGTVIPQGKEIAWYAQTYQGFHGIILMLKLNDVFHSWYFLLLLFLLGLNLTLCSLVRVRSIAKLRDAETNLLLSAPNRFALTEAQRNTVREGLLAMRCREQEAENGALIYRKNGFGRYGSFLTHLSILLTLIFGAAALYLPQITDKTCLPGEALTMDDGTEIRVESFRIEDADGRLDFTSEINIRLPDGRESGVHEIKVNHPLSFGTWKVYQQTYSTAGRITVRNLNTDLEDTFTLTELVFLSLDGVNGLWYEVLYPDMIRDPSGNVTLISNVSGSYPNPVYQVETASDGVYTPILAFPGDELQVGDLRFTFEDPVEYPGLRIKYTPKVVNALLVAAFLLMIAGLYITFFCQPVLVKLDEDACAVGGPKPEGTLLAVQGWLEENQKGENS
jgi:cytochrome c biogenesis protein